MNGLKIILNDTDLYYIYSNNAQSGPFSLAVLSEMRAGGTLTDQAYIAVNGAWVSAADISWKTAPGAAASPGPIPVPGMQPSAPQPEQELTTADTNLLEEIGASSGKMATCPHCWHKFDMSRVNYISKHPDLLGDPIVGAGEQQRFLPTRFNSQGYAIDAKGMVCTDMACPNCHLPLPVSATELPSSMFSIVGAPASGKSYYLTSAIWKLRSALAQRFDLSLSDTDETFNAVLNNYESLLFLNRQQDQVVSLPKTEVAGADYTNQIKLNNIIMDLPKPFIFTLTPTPSHPSYGDSESNLLRNIVLYDNGGEHFEPGRDSVNNPSTSHLTYSDSIVFLYDPMKDTRLMSMCNAADPQLRQTQYKGNQLVLLNEMITRIRRYSGLRSREKFNKMLIVVIPKYDAWREIFPVDLEKTDYCYYDEKEMKYFLDLTAVTNVSFIMREILLKVLPEVVATCESFFSTVYFLPASALGSIPEYDDATGSIGIRPKNVKPIWAEVPMLLQFWFSNLIDAVVPNIENCVPVEKYKFTEDSLLYSLPNQRGRFTVPANYWGRTVYSSLINQYIRFPEVTSAKPEEKAENGQTLSADADDFWK